MQLYIIRHGQSVNNATLDMSKHILDTPLTDVGQQQAEYLAQHIANAAYELTHLYTSPMVRTLQTTQPVMKVLDLSPQVWVDIHEHGGVVIHRNGGYVNGPGLTHDEMRGQFPDYDVPEAVTEQGWWHRESGAESLASCHARGQKVAAVLLERARLLAENGAEERIALVSHGTFADGLIKAILDKPANGMYYGHNNTGITRIDYDEGGRPELRFTNRTEHLPPDLLTR